MSLDTQSKIADQAVGSAVNAAKKKAGQGPAGELAKELKACCLEARAVADFALARDMGTKEDLVKLVLQTHDGLEKAVKDLKKMLEKFGTTPGDAAAAAYERPDH
eukprot:Hpha_TRINITY_DN16902_c2_g3::TRINITY_DN16902_c2_g3_i5::g.55803::m.55803